MQTKTKLLNRRRINQKLENIFLYPLSIVHAPIGYGKTTAVSQFLNQYAGTADLVWVSLAGSGGPVPETAVLYFDGKIPEIYRRGDSTVFQYGRLYAV